MIEEILEIVRHCGFHVLTDTPFDDTPIKRAPKSRDRYFDFFYGRDLAFRVRKTSRHSEVILTLRCVDETYSISKPGDYFDRAGMVFLPQTVLLVTLEDIISSRLSSMLEAGWAPERRKGAPVFRFFANLDIEGDPLPARVVVNVGTNETSVVRYREVDWSSEPQRHERTAPFNVVSGTGLDDLRRMLAQ